MNENKEVSIESEETVESKREVTFTFNNTKILAWSIMAPLSVFLVMTMLNKGGAINGAKWIFDNFFVSIINFALIFSLINILAIFARRKLYLIMTSVGSIVIWVLSYISYIKTELRGEPLTILDYKLLNEAVNISSALDKNLLIPVAILGSMLFLLILGIFIFVKMEVDKIVGIILSSISLFILSIGVSMNIDQLYKMGVDIPADTSFNHEQNGFILATLIDSKFMNIPKPKGYSKERIKEIQIRMKAAYATVDRIQKEKPNVVFVMSESFWDPELADGLKLNKDPIPNFRKLSNEHVSGLVEVPGIGGGTANTEFEVLTGLTRNFIQNYSVPYNPYNNYVNRPMLSLANTFKESDYTATAIHTYQSWFYKRNEVYKHLGFDKYISLETMLKEPIIDGLYADDSMLNEMILEEIQNNEQSSFIYAVTMQGHGPYDEMPLTEREVKVETDLPKETKKTLENYFNNINDVDKDLGELVSKLKMLNEPTILVYFGDHIPPIGLEKYEEFGFDIYGENGKTVPVVIWNNYEQRKGEIKFNINMLGAYVLNESNLESNEFFDYLYKYSTATPEIDNEGRGSYYGDFEMLHYDIMHGEQYIYELIGKPKINDEYEVGYSLKLEEVMAKEDGEYYTLDILGSGIGWMTNIYLNGKEIETKVHNGGRATIKIERNVLDGMGNLEISAITKDNRGVVIKDSGALKIGNVEELKANYKEERLWTNLSLGSDLDWELFSTSDNFVVVRANMKLPEREYQVKNGDVVLQDELADLMGRGNLSDIYPNGYMYISIDSKEIDSREEIKEYFRENDYNLKIAR